MKTWILLFACLYAAFASGQTVVKQITPTGAAVIHSPGLTINNSSALTTIFADTMPAGTIAAGRVYECDIYASLTTPALTIPTLSITVSFGGTSVSLASTAALGITLSKRPFRIHLVMFSNTLSSQYLFAEAFTDGGTITLGSAYVAKSATISADLTAQQIVNVAAQFSAASASTTLFIDNVYRYPF